MSKRKESRVHVAFWLLAMLFTFILTMQYFLAITMDHQIMKTADNRLMQAKQPHVNNKKPKTARNSTVSSTGSSLTSPSTPTVWSNRYNVVHVFTSRFQQHQAELKHLAKARMELLKAITLPSLQQQSNQEFLWILRVDPHLDHETMSTLLNATKAMSNLVIHLTNENPEGFRSIPKNAYKRLANPKSRALLESYIEAAKAHTVLESRLDADDALHVSFVEHLQRDASKQFERITGNWLIWCIENHLEWQQNSPWQVNASAILGWKPRYCVTPGLTWGYPVNVTRGKNVVTSHHKIHKHIPKCKGEHASQPHTQGNCLRKLVGASPMALRARTFTSAGMGNLVLEDGNGQHITAAQETHWKSKQETLFDQIESMFGVTPASLDHVRTELGRNAHDIALDALRGQCTAGHSCKESAKEALKHLLELTVNTTSS
jgi:hypothetical protein